MNYILNPYDNCLKDILNYGELKKDNKDIETLFIFGYQMKFDISKKFPILTKRKINPKAGFAELLWMLSGSTNVKELERLGTKIWNPWVSKSFEEKNNYEEGELGPIYGWQLRNFGGDYSKRNDKNIKNGFDQIEYIISQLKNNPSSRRILFSYWYPEDVTTTRVVLPPCHFSFVLSSYKDSLSGMVTLRSNDIPIGLPYNMIFYSSLIYMLAQQCNLKPKELIVSIADAHIYTNQIEAVKQYLAAECFDSPSISLNKAKDIYSYTMDDFIINDYKCSPNIKIPVTDTST